MILEPGDVITTGTPPGVGMGKTPPRFLQAGDTVSLGIEGLGQQAQRVVAWKAGGARANEAAQIMAGATFAALYAIAFIAPMSTISAAGNGSPIFRCPARPALRVDMRLLTGGSFDIRGDMTGRVLAAALFCCVLAYLAGLSVETIVRLLVRLALRSRAERAASRSALEHQHEVLNRRARGALAKIVELGDQHRLPAASFANTRSWMSFVPFSDSGSRRGPPPSATRT